VINLNLVSPQALTAAPGVSGTFKAMISVELTVIEGHVSALTLGRHFNYEVIKGPCGLEFIAEPVNPQL
jgi:hypothetical protein